MANDDLLGHREFVEEGREAEPERLHAHEIDLALDRASARHIRESRSV